VVLFIDSKKKKKKKKKKIILVSHCEKKKNETQCLEREAATRESPNADLSPEGKKRVLFFEARHTERLENSRGKKPSSTRATTLESSRRCGRVDASTGLFRATILSALPFFPGRRVSLCRYDFSAREVLKNESPNGTTRRSTAPRTRKNASFDIDSSQFPRSSPFFVAFVDRAPLPPARTHARARPTIAVSRIVAQKRKKTGERERKEDDANRATVSSLSRRERKQ
jgi:hypothetical protein